MTRFKAAAIHLCISLVVVGTIAGTVFLLWYPRGLWHVAGLNQLFIVMLGIDIVVGPLLTLIVYNTAKPELPRDLAVVALLQLAFLGYGLHTAWVSRPVFLVGAVGRLTLVYANEIDDAALAAARDPRFATRRWNGAMLVGAERPTDAAERQAVLMSALKTGTDLEQMPRYFVAYPKVSPSLLAAARRVDRLTLEDGEREAAIRDAIDATGRGADQLRALLIVSSRGEGTALLDAVSGEPLRTLSLDFSGTPVDK